MLDLKFIRENPEAIKDAAKKKAMDVDVDRILELDSERRKTLQVTESLRAEQNRVSEIVSKGGEQKDRRIEEMKQVKENLQNQELYLKKTEEELDELLKQVPNIPFDDVPVGEDENANVVLREEGKKPKFSFEPRDYMEIAKENDWIDIERASKVSGTRFGYIKGDAALLEFAIVQYAMSFLVKEGFIPILPPVLVRPEYMEAMGFLHADAKDDVYYLEKDDLYLVGTSEQTVGPMHAGEVFKSEDLPRRYVGFSTCFRREAGSYGRDTRGILRVHQFDKVEMLVFSHPDKSREEHKYLLSLNEKMMKELKLPYRVVHISTGDMGLSKAEQFDIETWIPSENNYRETHSASNTTDFQARRLKIKFDESGEKKYVHMLNATVFAIGRTLIAIIENYQTKDGKVEVPKALQPYIGKKKLQD